MHCSRRKSRPIAAASSARRASCRAPGHPRRARGRRRGWSRARVRGGRASRRRPRHPVEDLGAQAAPPRRRGAPLRRHRAGVRSGSGPWAFSSWGCGGAAVGRWSGRRADSGGGGWGAPCAGGCRAVPPRQRLQPGQRRGERGVRGASALPAGGGPGSAPRSAPPPAAERSSRSRPRRASCAAADGTAAPTASGDAPAAAGAGDQPRWATSRRSPPAARWGRPATAATASPSAERHAESPQLRRPQADGVGRVHAENHAATPMARPAGR